MHLGIFGGGQLGRMLALVGRSLDIRCRVFDPDPDACAGEVADLVTGAYDDPVALKRFATGLDLATYEFENVPLPAVRFVARRLPLFPPAPALKIAQDRLVEKTFLQNLGIPVAPFAPVDRRSDLDAAARQTGLPAILKTRHAGYDGKGQWVLHDKREIDPTWKAVVSVSTSNHSPKVTGRSRRLILEGRIPFQRELSLISVSAKGGKTRFYPLVETHHQRQILRWSIAPAPASARGLQRKAETYASKVIHALRYVGVLTIEFFQVEDRLIANEIAPRVHNSGHWTIEGAETSQFENHLRALVGLPLGSTAPRGCSAMINLIGEVKHSSDLLSIPGTHLHLYGKKPRPGRKIGHVTLRADDPATLQTRLRRLRRYLPDSP